MKSTDENIASEHELHALKDVRLVYRGCSLAFAGWLNQGSVSDVIGRTDQQLLNSTFAQQLKAEESLVLRDSVPSVATAIVPPGSCLLRLPLRGRNQIQGLDLLLVENERLYDVLLRHFFQSAEVCSSSTPKNLSVYSLDEILYNSKLASENQKDPARWESIKPQLPDEILGWLDADGSQPDVRSRAGVLQRSENVQHTDQNIWWCLLYWGTEPAIAVIENLSLNDVTVGSQLWNQKPTVDGYRGLVEKHAAGLILLNSGQPVFANASAALMLGFADVETLIEHGDIVGLVPQELKNYLSLEILDSTQQVHRSEGEWISQSGRKSFLMSHWQSIEWANQSCIYLTLTDISHRRRAEQSQRRNQQRFQDFAELAADFFWELDTSLRFNFVSRRFENILQIAPQNVLGLSIRQFYERYFPQPAPPQWRRHLQALSQHKAEREFEYRWTRADGKERVIVHTCQPLFDAEGNFEGYRGVGRDVTHDRALAAQVQFHATHDALTGLVNRREFERLLEEALHDSDNRQRHALCYVDLDNFKIVNDTCGHSAGDELLRQLGDLFRERVRQSDVVGRLGGDEFGILIYSCSMEQALDLAEKIRLSVMQFEFLWENKRFSIGASIGLSGIVPDTSSANEVMRAADTACYASKESGRNQVTTASEEMGLRRTDAERVFQVGNLLDEGQFRLWRQPILALNDKHYRGDHFEILMRLVKPDGTLILPETIMPAVERYGLCPKLDRLVFDRCLAWIVSARDQIEQLAVCNINLSGPSLLDQNLVAHMETEIKRSGIPPQKLCFELSETATIANLSSARDVIARLGKVGCKFALDDFGSGVSSFTFLQGLPIDFVKIDGSFVTRMTDDKVCEEMVDSINRVSHVLRCSTVAKSVENARTLDALESLGVDFAQGNYIGPPEAIDERLV